jgi:hypothetical protein
MPEFKPGLYTSLSGSQRNVVYRGWPISALVYEPAQMRGRVLANEYICAQRAQINFGDLTPNLTYDLVVPYSAKFTIQILSRADSI